MTGDVPADATELRERIATLRHAREVRKTEAGRRRRARLSPSDRARVLAKTAGQCHICGGKIDGPWQADHVLTHSGGGVGDPENYLPSHALCNNCRWDYLPDEFQIILKLGVWARTQIERDTRVGREIARRFVRYDASRISRRRGVAGAEGRSSRSGGAG